MKKGLILGFLLAGIMTTTVCAASGAGYQISIPTKGGAVEFQCRQEIFSIGSRAIPEAEFSATFPSKAEGKKIYLDLVYTDTGEHAPVRMDIEPSREFRQTLDGLSQQEVDDQYNAFYERVSELENNIYAIEAVSGKQDFIFSCYVESTDDTIVNQDYGISLRVLGGKAYSDNLFYGQEDNIICPDFHYFYTALDRKEDITDVPCHMEIKAGEKTILVNEKEYPLDAPAYISDTGRMMIPIRGITEGLPEGFQNKIFWDKEKQTAYVLFGQTVYHMTAGESKIDTETKEIPLKAPITIQDGRMYLPLDAIGTLWSSCEIQWDSANKTAVLDGTLSYEISKAE